MKDKNVGLFFVTTFFDLLVLQTMIIKVNLLQFLLFNNLFFNHDNQKNFNDRTKVLVIHFYVDDWTLELYFIFFCLHFI